MTNLKDTPLKDLQAEIQRRANENLSMRVSLMEAPGGGRWLAADLTAFTNNYCQLDEVMLVVENGKIKFISGEELHQRHLEQIRKLTHQGDDQ